jgi:4-amino-4-deoxy-L-arabinose transferase-like glycosyltransferase
MWSQFTDSAQKMTPLQVAEHATLFILLVLALVMFFKSSSPFNRYFIPIICILATVLRVLHWVYHGNEPEFMTPVVTWVGNLIS